MYSWMVPAMFLVPGCYPLVLFVLRLVRGVKSQNKARDVARTEQLMREASYDNLIRQVGHYQPERKVELP